MRGLSLSFTVYISENPEIVDKESDFKRPCCTIIVNSSRNNSKTLAPVIQSCHIHDTLKSCGTPSWNEAYGRVSVRYATIYWLGQRVGGRYQLAEASTTMCTFEAGRGVKRSIDLVGLPSPRSPQHLLHGLDPSIVDDAVLSNPGRRLKRLVEVMLSADIHEFSPF